MMGKYYKIKPKFDNREVAWSPNPSPTSNFNQWSILQGTMVGFVLLSTYEEQKKRVLEAFDKNVDDILLKSIREEMKRQKIFIKKSSAPDYRGINSSSLPVVMFRKTIPVKAKEFFSKAKKNSLYVIVSGLDGKEYSKTLDSNMKDSLAAGGQQVFSEFNIDINFQHLNPKIVEWGENYNLTLGDRVSNTLAENIKFEILEGIQNYEGIPEIRERILGVFDEPLTVQIPASVRPDGEIVRKAHERHITSEQWATWIARSETIRWAANGKVLGYRQTGVVKGVIFIATGDHRTCGDCMILNGTEFTLEDAEGVIPIHCQGRCTWVPEIREEYSAELDKIAYDNIVELYGLDTGA